MTETRVVLLTGSASVAERAATAIEQVGQRLVAVVAPAGERYAGRTRALVEAPPAGAEAVLAAREQLAATLSRLAPELVLCQLYPWLVPAEALAVPPLGALNGHPSLLPRHRGPLPLAWTLRQGDEQVGYTYHRMTTAFNAGTVLTQDAEPLGHDDGPDEVAAAVDRLVARLLPDALARAAAREPGWPQDEAAATPAPRFEPAYARVDWGAAAEDVHRQVRAWWFAGPGPAAVVAGEPLRLVRTRVEPADAGEPGDVLGRDPDGPLVRCGEDAVRVLAAEPLA